jgi:hypothetical protein
MIIESRAKPPGEEENDDSSGDGAVLAASALSTWSILAGSES